MLMPPAGRRGSKAVVLVELLGGRVVAPPAVVRAVPVPVCVLPELAGVVWEAEESLVEAGSEPLAGVEGLDVSVAEGESVAEDFAESAPGHCSSAPYRLRKCGLQLTA